MKQSKLVLSLRGVLLGKTLSKVVLVPGESPYTISCIILQTTTGEDITLEVDAGQSEIAFMEKQELERFQQEMDALCGTQIVAIDQQKTEESPNELWGAGIRFVCRITNAQRKSVGLQSHEAVAPCEIFPHGELHLRVREAGETAA